MPVKKIFLIDQAPAMTQAWQQAFANNDMVEVIQGDYFSQPADAMISPANSFGIMDGGLDLAIRHELGYAVETSLQQHIIHQFHGELPIGSAVIIATKHTNWPFLIAAPTMRIPENISQTLNPYWAFRAILLAIKQHNQQHEHPIQSFVCSGLGTGIGGMEPRKCAGQMKVALDSLLKPARIPSYHEIRNTHKTLQRII